MNRKQKIIVSVVGITIVMLALLGITYAYYLTRIEGNTNTNSISITTAKLELTYGDGNGMLLPYGTIEPNSDKSIKFYKTDSSGNPITNEPPVDNKTFTVTNNGNDSSYVVIIDNVSVTKASDGSSTSFISNDFRYTLTCTKSDGTKCNDVSDLTIFPIKGGILVSNDIKAEDIHTYTLTMWYIDTGTDQSDDMGKTYQARVNIADVNQMENPFMTGVSATDNASLAYNIINNSKENKNGTKLLNVAATPVAEDIARYKAEIVYSGTSWDYGTYDDLYNMCSASSATTCTNDMIGLYIGQNCNAPVGIITKCDNGKPIVSVFTDEYESSLATTQDDLGTSYYYRGAVEDNYVTFADMCWRIVRINGDGSIKLTLESQNPCSENMISDFIIGTTNWGYKIVNGKYIGDYKNSTSGMKNLLTSWFDTKFKSNGNLTKAGSKIKDEEWCLGNTTNTYAYSSPYGELVTTAPENHTLGTNFYYETGRNLQGLGVSPNATLRCNGEKDISKIGALTADEVVFAGGKVGNENNNYYLQENGNYWCTISRSFFYETYDFMFCVIFNGSLSSDSVSLSGSVRPAVSLNTNVKITSGEGTKKNPYIIDEE